MIMERKLAVVITLALGLLLFCTSIAAAQEGLSTPINSDNLKLVSATISAKSASRSPQEASSFSALSNPCTIGSICQFIDPAADVWTGSPYLLTGAEYRDRVSSQLSLPVKVAAHSMGTAFEAGIAPKAASREGNHEAPAEPGGVTPPDIMVSPSSLGSTQPPDVQVTHTFTISNLGQADLKWTVLEDAPQTSWSDNFDSYATGSQLHGQGGWKGWNNNPAGSALVTDTVSLSAPNAMESAGASDMVHEYTGHTSGSWIFSAWQYIPSGFSGDMYFILLNTYTDGGPDNWSTQVVFSSGSGLVSNTGASGGSLPLLMDQWVEIRMEINLDTDKQAFLYDNQTLYSGTWTGEVSGGGALEIAAIELYANGSSPLYYDNLQLVDPAASYCTGSDGIPWASASPTVGTTSPAADSLVSVTFDSTSLTTGIYTGTLCIDSNDPDEPEVTLPLTLAVQTATQNLYLPIVPHKSMSANYAQTKPNV
jgi:hypothetical protein